MPEIMNIGSSFFELEENLDDIFFDAINCNCRIFAVNFNAMSVFCNIWRKDLRRVSIASAQH